MHTPPEEKSQEVLHKGHEHDKSKLHYEFDVEVFRRRG